MPEPKLVEAVARAICRTTCKGEAHPCDLGEDGICLPGHCMEWRLHAEGSHAALDAIRNHAFGETAVLANGTDLVAKLPGDVPQTVLRALIDLAMVEGGEHGQDA